MSRENWGKERKTHGRERGECERSAAKNAGGLKASGRERAIERGRAREQKKHVWENPATMKSPLESC